ncbi:hypothetical protein HYPGJ_20001 [Hyphomicrobium sp. GJ21]|nr:hypothetical protein HYPGJ_20001 [Hyphomicrobium sp. GJ21]
MSERTPFVMVGVDRVPLRLEFAVRVRIPTDCALPLDALFFSPPLHGEGLGVGWRTRRTVGENSRVARKGSRPGRRKESRSFQRITPGALPPPLPPSPQGGGELAAVRSALLRRETRMQPAVP